MISLPNLSASSKTPLPGQVSPRAAAAPGMALAGLGRNVTQAGQVAGSIALDIQEAENQATMSEAMRELSERQAAFESSLLDDHDYRNYARRAEEEVIRPARSLITPDMAPVVRQALTERIEGWASDLRIGTNKAAQLKAISRAKTELVRTRESYIQNGQLEPYLSHLQAQTYLSPEERSLEADRARRLHTDRQQEIDIMRDPAAWLADHADDDPGTNPAKHRARLSLARQQLRTITADTSAEVLDLIVDNKLSTPEEIDQLAADLRPAARQRLKDILADHSAGRLEARLASPEAQKAIIGQLAAGIGAYQSTGAHFDADYVRLDGLLRQLNNGSLRDEFKRRLAIIREGQTATIDNAADLGRDRLARAFKAELFGPTEPATPPGQTLRSLLDAGLLTDQAEDSKLRRFGFTSQQAADIAGADNPVAKFRELYSQREHPNGLTPWETSVFQAIHDGATPSTRFPGPTNPADTFQALEPTYRAYGDALRQFDEWTRNTPNLDADKAEAKANELIKHPQALQLQRGIITPRPAAPTASGFSTSTGRADLRAQGGAPILLDANWGRPTRKGITSPLIVIPDDATPAQRTAAQRYVKEMEALHAKLGRNLKGRVVTRSQNGRGRSNAIHTEGFAITDTEMVKYLQTDAGRSTYANILRSTLGTLPGAEFFLPHDANDPGAVNKTLGLSEVTLAQSLMPALTK